MALLPIGVMLAQTDSTRTVKDTKRELRRQRVAKRNLHYNILGGPSYTPDFGFLVGGSALMTFRMNPSDTTQRRSVVPMSIALIFNGGLNLMTKPQLFFKGDRFRIFGTFSYKTPSKTSTVSDITQTRTIREGKIRVNTDTAAFR